MNVHYRHRGILAVLSVCLLIAIFSVLPQYGSLSNSPAALVSLSASGWVRSTPVTPQLLLTLPITTTDQETGWRQPLKTFEEPSQGDNPISQFGEIVTRLRRIFWAIARRCQVALQSSKALLITETNLAHKGDDMLENAA